MVGVGVNRKWSGISLGAMWWVWGLTGSDLGLVWESCGVCWGSTGSGLVLVWGLCGWCGGQPEVVLGLVWSSHVVKIVLGVNRKWFNRTLVWDVMTGVFLVGLGLIESGLGGCGAVLRMNLKWSGVSKIGSRTFLMSRHFFPENCLDMFGHQKCPKLVPEHF